MVYQMSDVFLQCIFALVKFHIIMLMKHIFGTIAPLCIYAKSPPAVSYSLRPCGL